MPGNRDVIVIFSIYGQFEAIWKPSLKKLFLLVTFYLTKTEKRTKKSLIQLSHYCFEWRYYFCQKTLIFCKKNTDAIKIKGALY